VSRPGAFLDRDGTLNVRAAEHHYICSIDEFSWLPGAVDGAVRLARAGYALVVVSNQRGLARGLVTTAVLREIEQRIQDALAPHGCRVEAFRYCPHDHADACACRKPAPGLLLAAAADLGLDLGASWMIGDAASDVRAGRGAGCHTALIGGDGGGSEADLCADGLDAASELIVARTPLRVA